MPFDKGAQVPALLVGGDGKARPNTEFPDYLNTSISLISMEAEVPESTTIGRNCVVFPDVRYDDFRGSQNIEDGENVRPIVHKV